MSEMNSSGNTQNTPAAPPTPPAVPAVPTPPAAPVAQTPAPVAQTPAPAPAKHAVASTPAPATQQPTATASYGAPQNAQFATQSVPNAYAPQAGQGFFARLFDLSFSQYHTKAFVKLTYILSLVFVWVAWLVYVIQGTVELAGVYGNGMSAVVFFLKAFFIGALLAFVVTLFIRLILEFYVATVNNAEDTRRLRELKEEEVK